MAGGSTAIAQRVSERHVVESAFATIPDVQGSPDARSLALQKVGVRGVRLPVVLRDREGENQHSVANVGMFISLAADNRGAHMSRFLEVVGTGPLALDVASLEELGRRMLARLESERVAIDLAFPYFVRKHAPVSGSAGLVDYEVELGLRGDARDMQIRLGLSVPVTSLCPCSKAISAYGAHSQRSRVIVSLTTRGDPWIDDLIEMVEAEASSELFALLKREDEAAVTERAYDNPKFVEDLVRDVASRLEQDPRVGAYRVSCENFESIHNHSAYALIERDGAERSD